MRLSHGFLPNLYAAIGCFVLQLMLTAAELDDLTIYPALPLLACAPDRATSLSARILALPPLYGLGVLSYSIYLQHVHLHMGLEQLNLRLPKIMPPDWAPWVAAGIIYAAVSFAALFCYHFIDKLRRDYLRRFFNRWQMPGGTIRETRDRQ